MTCHICQQYLDIINRALLTGDTDKAQVFQAMLENHQRDNCPDWTQKPQPVVAWKNQSWWEVREK